MKKQILIVVFLVATAFLFAGRYAGDFMAIGSGVRPLGMGGAYSAIADNGVAIYWNPAGLSQIKKTEFSFMHAFLYKDLATYDNLTFSQPLPSEVTIGLNWTRLTVEDIPYYAEEHLLGTTVDQRSSDPDLQLTGNPDGTFSSKDDLYQFAFSKNIHSDVNLGWLFFELPIDINFGGSIKYIKRDLEDHLGSGMGFDLALMFKTDLAVLMDIKGLGYISAAANFKDVGGTTITWDTASDHEDEIMQSTKTGYAFTQPIPAWKSKFILAMDVDYEYKDIYHYGLEWEYAETLALRGGYYDENFSSGVSLKFWNFALDYAFVTNVLGDTHRVGIKFIY